MEEAPLTKHVGRLSGYETKMRFSIDHDNGMDDQEAPSCSEPAVFRLPRPSPQQRFAWRGQGADGQVGTLSQGKPPICPFPDCVKEVEEGGVHGGVKKVPFTDSMMKAYLAVRAGASSIECSGIEPFLARISHQELGTEPGAHCMVQDTQDSVTLTLPEDEPDRAHLHYHDRYPADLHLSIPAGYDAEPLWAESLGNGWPSSTPTSGRQQPRVHERSSNLRKGNAKNRDKARDKVKDKYKDEEAPGNLATTIPDDDDGGCGCGGWVSDAEGHPEQARIAPCTFARWAVGCAAAAAAAVDAARPTPPRPRQGPAIPARSSSLCRFEPKGPAPPPPILPSALLSGVDAVEAVREIGALRQTLARLVREKQLLRGDIRALRREREELEAKIQGCAEKMMDGD
ncbi:uncharacterized protein P884DRAFT_327660 [Thermothelomyces heterothallicus CBS 202.75]|uniref:uncharacterized protein n=1 Tax=Thermothelomyces heterothallicus CBS 202.75 TaxID=1149848 RepID=UPI003742017B